MDKHQHTIKMFSEYVAEYVGRFMNLGLYSDTFDEFAKMLPSKATVLELGCGPGNVAKYLLAKRSDLDILGIDLAPGMIEEAKKQNPGARFELMDIRETGQLKQRFNAIIAAFCLPYISYDDVPAMFENIHNLTAENAFLYVSFMEGNRQRSGFEKTSFTGDKEIYINYHDRLEIERLLEKNGFGLKAAFTKDYPEPDGSTTKDVILIAKKIS
jgi:cyclopropane fatty-acyl-phospholipid synthase-like methyltransferase